MKYTMVVNRTSDNRKSKGMILKDNFYTIACSEISENKAKFRIKLNAKNFVYQAHFPNSPITPGVILIQMAVELFDVRCEMSGMRQLEIANGKSQIKTLKNVKFIAPISPLEFPEVNFLLEFSNETLKVVIKEEETIFAKMSLVLRCYTQDMRYETGNTYDNTQSQIVVIIPVYNAENLIGDVIKSVLQYTANMIVVNDGSTDGTFDAICHCGFDTKSHNVVSYEKNRGKGYALQQGFRRALELGYTHAVTFDADGQHLAGDITVMAHKSAENPDALIVGSRKFDNPNIPQGNVFANKFSNFWFLLQTAKKLPDTQTGFRLYPLRKIGKIRLFTNRYETELELLVRCSWQGIKLVPQPINVYYPPIEERVSHFRGGKDFFRISLLNAILCLAAIVYGYPSILIRYAVNRCAICDSRKSQIKDLKSTL
jgi:glycosyltransferase involved in cell wall biosynthesis/3-hydroxymyristoyl/3-hydroxydecanoyl-(acyl carrier protein) dehydratase